MSSKTEIRRLMRRRRQRLPPHRRRHAAGALREAVCHTLPWRNATRIGLFLPADGEIDVRPLIRIAWREDRRVYLPVLLGGVGRMAFTRYRPHDRLVRNRFRILEPTGSRRDRINPRRLDLVLAPLVAFDAAGHRLGMGGGFYDRAFSFLRRRPQPWHRPHLIGVAYGFQEVAALPAEPWDIPLHGIFTERGLRRCRSTRGPASPNHRGASASMTG